MGDTEIRRYGDTEVLTASPTRRVTVSQMAPDPHKDDFYQGVITKIFWGNNTGVIRSDTGKEVPFTFAFVTLIGAPRHDIRYLCEGMRVGFDVGWTSKGLRVTVIKIYEDS